MHLCNQSTGSHECSAGLVFSLVDKEAVSPDGDSTTAPPSQASEHSEANSKQSNNGRPHPIDAALEQQIFPSALKAQIFVFGSILAFEIIGYTVGGTL